MSEQSSEVRRFDDDSRESVLVRYGWDLDVMEANGEVDFDLTYSRALMKLNDLYASVVHPSGLTFEAMCGKIYPPPFDESGLEAGQWCDRLRLAPALMLQKGAPELHSLTPNYIRCVIFAVLSKNSRHGAECMSYCDEENGVKCLQSDFCPAKSLNYIFVQTATDTVTSRFIHLDELDAAEDERTQRIVQTIRESLVSYGITTDEIFQAHLEATWFEDMRLLNEIEAA